MLFFLSHERGQSVHPIRIVCGHLCVRVHRTRTPESSLHACADWLHIGVGAPFTGVERSESRLWPFFRRASWSTVRLTVSERGAPWPTFKAALKRFLGCPVTVLPPSSNLPSSRFIAFNNHAGTGSAGVISHTSYYFNPNVFRSPPAPFCSFHWKQRQGCFTIFECVSSVVSEHRSQHPPQVRHCGVDASGSRRKQIRFVTANYRVRHLSEHGDDLEKQLWSVLPISTHLRPEAIGRYS